MDSRCRAGNMSLKHHIIPDSKEAAGDYWGPLKGSDANQKGSHWPTMRPWNTSEDNHYCASKRPMSKSTRFKSNWLLLLENAREPIRYFENINTGKGSSISCMNLTSG